MSAAGAGPWSAAATVTVPDLATPSSPLNFVLSSNSGDLVATWDEPADIEDVPVTGGYTLRFRGTGLNTRWHTKTVGSTQLQTRIEASYGLERGGTYRAQVRASGEGGDGPWSAESETTIPATGTKPVITATTQEPANRPFTITITFSQMVTGFNVDDLVVAPGDASELSGAGAVYTALITPTDSGTLTINIPFGAALDENDYESEAANTFSIEVDVTAPTGVIVTAEQGPFRGPFTIELTFSEPVQDLTVDDIAVNLGQVSDLAVANDSATRYTALVTPAGTGTLVITLAMETFYDYSGHWNEEPVVLQVEIDTERPTLRITSNTESPVTGPFALNFTFSEDVTGFTRDDVRFPNGAGYLLTLHSLTPRRYTGTARPTTTGEIMVQVPEGAARDAIGNPNEAAEFQITALVGDSQLPRARIWTTETSPRRGPFEIMIDFSEPVVGMTADKLIVTNGAIGILIDKQNARTEYSTTLWPERSGTVTVNLPAGVVEDDLGNLNAASDEFSIEVLTPVPAVPAAGLILLGAALAAAGWRKRRRAARA